MILHDFIGWLVFLFLVICKVAGGGSGGGGGGSPE